MREFMKKHDVWLRLLSLVLAVVLWAVVMDQEDPNKSYTYNDVPVTLTGELTLKEDLGLSVIEGMDQLVNVTVNGQRSIVASLRKNITVTADVSSCTNPGEYDVPVVVSAPGTVQVLSPGRNATIHVRIDRLATKEVEVRLGKGGSTAAADYLLKDPTSPTTKVVVEGPESELDQVAYAYAVIEVAGISSAVKQDCEVVLYNESGEPVESTHIRSQTKTVSVTLGVYQRGTVPLKVTLKESDTVKADMAQVRIEPESVRVYGDQNQLATLTEINLGDIDLASVETGSAKSLSISSRLPKGVELETGQPVTALVTVTIDGVDTQALKIAKDDIIVTDTADEQRLNVRVMSEGVEIQLRGSRTDLDQIKASMFTVAIAVDSSALGEGTHTVTGLVTANGLPEGVTLIEDKVEVQVLIESGAAFEPGGIQDAEGVMAGSEAAQ